MYFGDSQGVTSAHDDEGHPDDVAQRDRDYRKQVTAAHKVGHQSIGDGEDEKGITQPVQRGTVGPPRAAHGSVEEAEKENVEARNQLEAYLYNLKNSINDTLEGKIDESDKDELSKSIEEALVWLEDNPAAEKVQCDEKQKEVEGLANPILKKAYESAANEAGAGGGMGGPPPGDDDDFMGADLDGAGDNDEPSVEEVD